MHFYFSATEFEYSNFFSCLVKEYKLKTDCKYGQYCTPLSQSNCRYFFVLVIIENTVPKKVLFIVLLYLVISLLCLRTLLQKSINSNISFCKIKFFLNHQHDQLTFLGSKIRYLFVYALTLFISWREVDAMLPITVKLAVLLKLQLVNTQAPLTNRRSKSKKSTGVKYHMLIYDQPVSFDDLKPLLLVTLSSI